jgi:hypothetical protein
MGRADLIGNGKKQLIPRHTVEDPDRIAGAWHSRRPARCATTPEAGREVMLRGGLTRWEQ